MPPSTVLALPQEADISMNSHCDYAEYLVPTLLQFTISNFLVSEEEEEQLNLLHDALFRYFCLKESQTSKQLPGLAV